MNYDIIVSVLALRRFKSPVIQRFVQTNNKDNIKPTYNLCYQNTLLHGWPLIKGQ